MHKLARTAIGLALVTALMATAVPAQAGPFESGTPCPDDLDVLCPRPVPGGASCRSYGVVIVERDTSGVVGSVVVDHSESRAWTEAIPGPTQDPPDPENQTMPDPPKDPQAHADAQQAGFSYTTTLAGGISLDTSEVFSRCDVVALDTPEGLYTESYGRAGVADLDLQLSGPGISIGAEALDFEEHAYGTDWATYSFEACDVAELTITPGPSVAHCPGKNTGMTLGTVTVEVHDSWGPTTNAAGQSVYGGAALHVSISTGPQTVDIYVGYVAVAVDGASPVLTSTYTPNTCSPTLFGICN